MVGNVVGLHRYVVGCVSASNARIPLRLLDARQSVVGCARSC